MRESKVVFGMGWGLAVLAATLAAPSCGGNENQGGGGIADAGPDATVDAAVDGPVVDVAADGPAGDRPADAPPADGPGSDARQTDGPPIAANACRPVGTPREVYPAMGTSRGPAIAWDGTAYAVVWDDSRSGSKAILGALLRPDGSAVNPGFVVASLAGKPLFNPEVAAVPGGFLVVYEGCEVANGDECVDRSVKALRLDTAAQPVGTPRTIGDVGPEQQRPYVIAAFGRAYVAYRTKLVGGKTIVKIVAVNAATAEALITPATLTLDNPDDTLFPHISANETNIAIAYVTGPSQRRVELLIVDQNLQAAKKAVVRDLPSETANPVVAPVTGGFVVAWEDMRGGDERIYTAAVSADGNTVGASRELYPRNGNWPAFASSGASALVTFHGFPSGAQVLGARIGPDGQAVAAPSGISNVGTQQGRFGNVLWNPIAGEFVAVFEDRSPDDIAFTRVSCP
jgi:hypothetical protein